MIVAGWADGYRNNTFRTFERLTCPKRLLAGPWSHMSTSNSLPGPHLDLVPELVDWFGHHLRGDDNGVDDSTAHPGLRAGRRSSPRPTWPSTRASGGPCPAGRRPSTARPRSRSTAPARCCCPTPTTWASRPGTRAPATLPWGQPTDQVADEARSLLLRWPAPEQGIDVIGQPRLRLRVRCDRPIVTLSAKLSDGLPGGSSHLVCRGFLNLAHRESSVEPSEVPFGEWLDLVIDLEATTWHFDPGHEVRLALSRSDWPNAWPAPEVGADRGRPGVDRPRAPDRRAPRPEHPGVPRAGRARDHGPELDESVEQPPVRWWIEHDVLGRRRTAKDEHGYVYTGRYDAQIEDAYTGATDVSTVDPSDAGAEGTARFEITWPEATVSASARLSVRSTADEYEVEIDLDVEESGQPFARRRWHEVIPRHLQ